MGLHITLVVLSLVVVVLRVNGAGPYTVNNRRSTYGCPSDKYGHLLNEQERPKGVPLPYVAELQTNMAEDSEYARSTLGFFSFETGTLDVMRGSRGAPCVGYLKFASPAGISLSSLRICTAGPLLFHKEAAKRACWTLGNNLYRDPITGEEIMLYSCDTYMEDNIEFPEEGSSTAPASAADLGFLLGPLQGKRCLTPFTPDSDCFGECYGLTDPGAFIDGGVEDDCFGIIPFWATTCSDIDECQNGVHGNCEGPFDEHCTLRPPCGPNAECTNMPGSWSCECQDGYKYTTASDLYDANIGCEDINECEDEDICGVNGQCRNTNGSFFCICDSRLLLDEATGKCTVGECSSPPALPNAYPTSSPGGSDYEDEVTYRCYPGYQVSSGELSGIVPTFYGYSDLTSFDLTCNAHGEWGPQPYPLCVPVYCGDPGVVANAVRSGSDFRFGKEVQFDCNRGYGVQRSFNFDDSFSVTCQADASWTDRETCEDIDECSQIPSPCGPSSKRCVNIVGGYFCICAPGYYQDELDEDSCVELEPETFPSPCKIMESIQFCDHGTCTMDDDKASCRCDVGYEGRACDRPIVSTALILGIVALALIGFFILMLVARCIHRWSHPGFVAPAAPVYGGAAPVYGGVPPAYAKRPIPLSDLGARRWPNFPF